MLHPAPSVVGGFRDPADGGEELTAAMALWFFQRFGPGDLKRVSNPSMQRFLVGERALPHDGDGFVRCIGMSVELRNRKPAQVSRVWFSKIRVRADGRVDPHHRPEVVRLARENAAVAVGHSVVAAR